MTSLILTLVLVATASGRSVVASLDDPPAPVQDKPEAITPIFLNAPSDLDAFWKMLSRPDFVVVDGEFYRKLLQKGESPGSAKTIAPAVVESLAVSGEVVGDWARIVLKYRVAMTTDGPTWVPIQLDGLTLSEVSDGSGDLPTKATEARAWLVELKGRGEHVVRVELLVPVRSTVEGRRLELAVPPASSTRLDLVVPQTVLDANTGANEPVSMVPVQDGVGVRLSARLSPRSRLNLAWRERADPAIKLPTLLTAQGEISWEIERGSIRSRSSWVVGSIRGTTSLLTLRLDSAEELLDIEVDGKPVQVESRREGGRSVVTIPLVDPLRANTTRALLLNTRRPIASSGTARLTLQGYSFDQARAQTGVIAIARSGPLFINPTPGRGLRRIDPRTELPESLRGRPDTTLAFEFNDQPFELGLVVEPAPPRLRVEARTTISVDPRTARVESRLDCRTSQGRVFEIRVILPRGLEFERAEPADIVESAQEVAFDPKAAPIPGVEGARVVTLTLTPQARESDAFTILLKGWSAIDPSKLVALPLFQPVVDSSEGTRFAIVADRNVSVEPAFTADDSSPFRVDWGLPPSDWAWPARRPGPELGLLWLRCDANPETMPLKVTVRPRSIRHESTLTASIDRRGTEVVDEISVEVAFGAVSRLDIALPPEIPARWEVEGVEVAGREPLGTDAGGARRYRLRFARDYTDSFRFRIRYRLPLAEPPEGDREVKIRLSPIRVLEGTSSGRRVLISSDPSFELKSGAKGWNALASAEASSTSEVTPSIRLALSNGEERPGPVDLILRAGPRLPFPGVVVSRLWIKTVQRPDDDLATSARLWVESRDGAVSVGLPRGSRLVKARVGGAELPEGSVEVLSDDGYRLRFPGNTPSGPVLVAIDFLVPSASTSGGWPTLQVLGGGIVQQTMWEVEVSGSRAGVGTPAGWTDENEWFWAGGVWKRRPWKSPLELSHWLTGGSARYRLNEMLETGDPVGNQAYLFSRVGPPDALHFPVFSRITLLLLCSGPVLAVGLLVLARRPPARMTAASILILVFATGSLIEPSVLIMVVQSSLLGVALCFSALAMNWAIERAGQARPNGDGALIVASSTNGSSMARPVPIGSDDSTAIRIRPPNSSGVSTADHVVLLRDPGIHPVDYPISGADDR